MEREPYVEIGQESFEDYSSGPNGVYPEGQSLAQNVEYNDTAILVGEGGLE